MQHKNKIFELHNQGKSYREIQEILGCSKGTISYHLGAGQKEKSNARQKQKRNIIKEYIANYKQSKVCADCKESYPYWMMDFDHLEDKVFTIARYYEYTLDLEKIKKEIEKCDVVCANCHRNRTHFRKLKNGSGLSLDLNDGSFMHYW